MTAALETLLLAFSSGDAPAIPPRALFIGAEPHPALKEWPDITGWQPLKPLATAWEKAGFTRAEDPPEEKFPLVMVLPGKSRDETLLWFAHARDRLAPGGTLLVSMPNTAGASRFEKELTKATGGITSLQKHKCRAFHATEDGTWDEAVFNEWRALSEPREVSGFTVVPGIFSSDHIDPGSQLLADHLPAHLRGKVADLGAGWGFLSDAVLKRCPKIERLDLYEADARALDCARINLSHHREPVAKLSSPPCQAEEEEKIHFHWHDVTIGLPDTYDVIIMNPPFHTGQSTDVDLGRAFLRTATASLRRGGRLLLVANRQLPYEAALEVNGLAWRKIAEDKIYKILFAEKR
ncbi:class I SAM-dependent methyltransferase [Luteolibacter yonseiensis]|uniref:Class I SAM-dependent methyltransferase n=1 Tax=Luteolibacter yonseiensis TaxID=1144680 RepID=A0A934R100_9BACT|nr:class I SAM-dependent methyltransferase [Luteolibacter yonseiensis]MBK1814487.1 class I SAM-dependent methyltransferase [Luteolibacter yonseiensis]